MNLFITGATGFLGYEVLRQLSSSNKVNKIFALYRNEEKKEVALDNLYCTHKVIFIKGNLNSFNIDDNIDIVIHCASKRPNECYADQVNAYEVNVDGTFNLLKKLNNFGVEKFIYISTQSVYGNLGSCLKEDSEIKLENVYSKTKYLAELVSKDLCNEKNTIILRPSRIIGPGKFTNTDNIVTYIFPNNIFNNSKIKLFGNIFKQVDLIDVRDVARAILHIVESDDINIWNEIYNITQNNGVTIKQIAECFTEWGKENDLTIDIIEADTYITSDKFILNNEKANNLLKWNPSISLNQSVFDLMNDFKNKKSL